MTALAVRGSDRLRLLFPEGSSASARATLYTLGPQCDIDLLDPDRLCMCRLSRFVQQVYRCPPLSGDPQAFLAFLTARLREGKYDVLFPTHEQVYLISRFREELSRFTHLAVPEFSALVRLQSKTSFARLLEQLNVPQPATRIVTSRAEMESHTEFPCYLKSPHGTAGRGVRLVEDAAGLKQAADEFAAAGLLDEQSEIVIQQPARGTHSVVQAVFQEGRLIGAHCMESLRLAVGGGQAQRVSVSQPVVVDYVRRIGEHLDWHGPMFFEYFWDAEAGQPQFFECNPRIGETVNALLAGINLPEALVRIALGEKVEPLPEGRPGVRSHIGFLMFMEPAWKGAGRVRMFQEFGQLITRRDGYAGANEMMRPREDWLSMLPAISIVSRLLIKPSAVHSIVEKAVRSYSVPESAARLIDTLSIEAVRAGSIAKS